MIIWWVFESYSVNIRGFQTVITSSNTFCTSSIVIHLLFFCDWLDTFLCTDQRNVCFSKNFSEAWGDGFSPGRLPKQGGRSLYVFSWKQLPDYWNQSCSWSLSNCLISSFPCCCRLVSVQVLAAVGRQEAECRFQKLLSCLSHPPAYTCVRASTHLAPLEEIRRKLGEELKKVNFYLNVFLRQWRPVKS